MWYMIFLHLHLTLKTVIGPLAMQAFCYRNEKKKTELFLIFY